MPTQLPAHLVARIVREALLEDIGPGDLTCNTLIDPLVRAEGRIVAGEALVVSGMQPALEAFHQLDPQMQILEQIEDGQSVDAGRVLLCLRGRAAALLSAERTALNFLGKLCGIATLARRCVELAAGTPARIYDTRKTTPGLRLLEKQAVSAGGAYNHRFGLFDAVLIKDNHLCLAGSAAGAVKIARDRLGPQIPIEVEIDTLEDLQPAIDAGADIVLLDNMAPDQVRAAVAQAAGRIALEASGGIGIDTLRAYAETGVDRISIGALTHAARSMNLSMTVAPAPADP
jgi:nicotinate-nucleotide pyrophosphorylase (carboxylating)